MEKPKLVIEFDPETSQVFVNGPLQNRGLCYMILKLAEKAIDENHAREMRKQHSLGIVPVRGNGGDLLRTLPLRK